MNTILSTCIVLSVLTAPAGPAAAPEEPASADDSDGAATGTSEGGGEVDSPAPAEQAQPAASGPAPAEPATQAVSGPAPAEAAPQTVSGTAPAEPAAAGSSPVEAQEDAPARGLDGRGGYAIPIGDSYGLRLGGQYRAMLNVNDYDWHGTDTARTDGVFNQRLRTWLNFHDRKVSHGAYFQLETGHIAFGQDNDYPKSYGNDRIGIELRRGFLFIKPKPNHILKVGIQGWHDRFGERPDFKEDHLFAVDAYDSFGALLANSVWDFNVGGISAEGSAGPSHRSHYRAGVFVLGATDPRIFREGAAFLCAFDFDQEIRRAVLGVSAYGVLDHGEYSYGTFGGPTATYNRAYDVWAGARLHLDFRHVDPSFAVIYNGGFVEEPRFVHHGVAGKAGLAAPTERAGTFRLQALMATGDTSDDPQQSTEFRTIAQSERDNRGSQGYWSYLAVSSPRGTSDIADLGIGMQNRRDGLVTAQFAWERAFVRDKLVLYAAIGWLAPAQRRLAEGDGAEEAVAELTWNIFKRLSWGVGVAGMYSHGFYQDAIDGSGLFFEGFSRLQLEL